MGLLSLAIWTPVLFGVLLLAMGGDKRDAGAVRWLALPGSVAGLAVTVPLYTGFETGSAAMQFAERVLWVPAFNIHYHLAIDGISLWLVLLTAFINVIEIGRAHV